MVKVSFNSVLAQKEVKKDAENLITEDDKQDVEAVLPVQHRSRAWCLCMVLGLALMLSGVMIGGAYLFRYYVVEVSRQFHQGWDSTSENIEKDQVYFCGVNYREEDYMIPEEDEVAVELPNQFRLRQLDEKITVLENEHVELISIPVPDFDTGDPADIVHDFQRMLTAYLDLKLSKCYIIPLNTSVIMPPKDFVELLNNIRAGTYLPQSYLVHEEMIVTERLSHVDQLGYFINNLCRGKETYKLQRRDRILGFQKREALNCHKIRHFGSHVVVETVICEL